MSAGLAPGRQAVVPVFCVTAHERRDLEVAEQVSQGRFTLAGHTRVLGLEPDWLGADLPPDEEWRIEWTKFYWGRDLAFAFEQTGDPRFLHAWERLVSTWIDQAPPGSDSSDVAARRIQNWLYAWQDFAAAPSFEGLASGLPERLAASVAEQAAYIRETLSPERNHRTLELYALFLAPLALPELDPDGELLAFAIAELEDALCAEFRADGVHRESSTHYHLIALRSFLGARENARRFGLAFSRDFDERLELACDFALHCTRPDGAIPALSDADTGDYGELLALAGRLLGRDDLTYVATHGRRGTPPGRRHVSFGVGGYHVQRSGWGEELTPYEHERFLIFDCGPLGDGGHGHYDLLSVEIAAGGRPLLVDPGRFTYSEEGPRNLRRWFKGTAAHNTVTVDGLDQTPYRRTRPRGRVAEGHLLGRVTRQGLDVLAGEARSPAYDAVHTRVVAFVGDRLWIIEDRLRGERRHRYDLRWHLAPEAMEETRVESAGVQAPGLALVFEGGAAPVLELGWVSPVYGRRLAAPVVSVVAEGADADFVTLIAPLGADEPRAENAAHAPSRGRGESDSGVDRHHKSTHLGRGRRCGEKAGVSPELAVRREGERTEVRVDGGEPVAWRVADGRLEVEARGAAPLASAPAPEPGS